MPSSHPFAALRRLPTPLLIVGGLHLAVVWAFLNGLQVHTAPPPPETDARVIDEAVPVLDRPPPPRVETRETRFTLPDIPVVITQPTEPGLTTVDDKAPAMTAEFVRIPEPVEAQPVIESASVDPRHPLTQPAYPMSSRRGSEEGALLLDVLVGTDGHVRDAKVSRSSGFDRLDLAAVSEAKQHWRLRPASRNGVAFEQWLTLRVVFRLADR